MPGTGKSLEARLAQAAPLAGTPGQAYVERRGVPELVAAAAMSGAAHTGCRRLNAAPCVNRSAGSGAR